MEFSLCSLRLLFQFSRQRLRVRDCLEFESDRRNSLNVLICRATYIYTLFEKREKLEAEQQKTGKDSLREIEYLSVRPLRCEETRRHRRKIQFYCTKNIYLLTVCWTHSRLDSIHTLARWKNYRFVRLKIMWVCLPYSNIQHMISWSNHTQISVDDYLLIGIDNSTQSRARGVCCCLTV